MTVPLYDFSLSSPVRQTSGVYRRMGKRAVDLFLVLLALPIFLPLMAIILVAVWIDGGAPLYAQTRVGRGGRTFRCWKVRTMVQGADAILARLVETDPAIAREWHENQKLASDPRVTRTGRLLRRSSLDELPQLWNVLNGTMSLVGPRPFTPEQRRLYDAGVPAPAYYDLVPGISGLWQISRRNAGTFGERVDFDEAYGRRISLKTDAWILWRTFGVVVRATGL